LRKEEIINKKRKETRINIIKGLKSLNVASVDKYNELLKTKFNNSNVKKKFMKVKERK
jgi:hypothetical protein